MNLNEMQSYVSGIYQGFINDSLPKITLVKNELDKEYNLLDIEMSYTRFGHTTKHSYTIGELYTKDQVEQCVNVNMIFIETKWDMENLYHCIDPYMRNALSTLHLSVTSVQRCNNDVQKRIVWLLGRSKILVTTPIDGYKNLEYSLSPDAMVSWRLLYNYGISQNFQ